MLEKILDRIDPVDRPLPFNATAALMLAASTSFFLLVLAAII